MLRIRKRMTHRRLYKEPFHAGHVLDPQLSDAKISVWTTICDDNVLMRDMLGSLLHASINSLRLFTRIFSWRTWLRKVKTFDHRYWSIPPLLENPPDWRLPAPSKDSYWYRETWIKYPLKQAPSPRIFPRRRFQSEKRVPRHHKRVFSDSIFERLRGQH